MKSFVLVIGLSGLFFCARAQDGNLPGYIVKNSGDTVRGLLKQQGSDESAKQISFKASETDKDYQVYTPDQLKSYRYDGGNLFRTVICPDRSQQAGAIGGTFFGKLLVTGEDDLYSLSTDGRLYFLVRKGDRFYLLFDENLETMPYVKGNFRNELNFLASGCMAMNKEIERAGYSVSEMIGFFQQLDSCLNPGKPVQTYLHDMGGYSGFTAYMGGISYADRGQFTLEVRWRRVWPQLDPNLSFNIGLRIVDLTKPVETAADPKSFVRASYQIVSVPITMQYNVNILQGRIHGFALAGLSLSAAHVDADSVVPDNSSARGFMIGVGAEAKITHCLWVHVEWCVDYMSQFPTVGLAVILP
jgi:hypothetical protein